MFDSFESKSNAFLTHSEFMLEVAADGTLNLTFDTTQQHTQQGEVPTGFKIRLR